MSTFSETKSLIAYMQSVGSTSLNIALGKEKVNPKTGEVTRAQYVQFVKADGGQIGTALRVTALSKGTWYVSGLIFGSGALATPAATS